MKKLLFASILILSPVFLRAQGPISFGPKIGWNMNRLTTDYTDYVREMKNGLQGGLFFSIYLDKFYFQPEAYFSLKRGAIETTIGDPNDPLSTVKVTQTINLKTIDIPILIGYKLIDAKVARLRIWGGPVASYLMNKEYVLSIDGLDQSDRITRDDFRDANWGVQLGAGLDILFLTFDVGYEFGLSDFLQISSLDDFDLSNNLFFCSIGWRLF
jgi:hypothetical protein